MWRDLMVAVALSVVFGLGSFVYDRYAYWRAWAPQRFATGLAFFILVNAAGGALAVAAAALLDWQPRPGAWAFNGLVYALVAQGLVRVELRARDLRYIEQ